MFGEKPQGSSQGRFQVRFQRALVKFAADGFVIQFGEKPFPLFVLIILEFSGEEMDGQPERQDNEGNQNPFIPRTSAERNELGVYMGKPD